jgi:hypothetical protein
MKRQTEKKRAVVESDEEEASSGAESDQDQETQKPKSDESGGEESSEHEAPEEEEQEPEQEKEPEAPKTQKQEKKKRIRRPAQRKPKEEKNEGLSRTVELLRNIYQKPDGREEVNQLLSLLLLDQAAHVTFQSPKADLSLWQLFDEKAKQEAMENGEAILSDDFELAKKRFFEDDDQDQEDWLPDPPRKTKDKALETLRNMGGNVCQRMWSTAMFCKAQNLLSLGFSEKAPSKVDENITAKMASVLKEARGKGVFPYHLVAAAASDKKKALNPRAYHVNMPIVHPHSHKPTCETSHYLLFGYADACVGFKGRTKQEARSLDLANHLLSLYMAANFPEEPHLHDLRIPEDLHISEKQDEDEKAAAKQEHKKRLDAFVLRINLLHKTSVKERLDAQKTGLLQSKNLEALCLAPDLNWKDVLVGAGAPKPPQGEPVAAVLKTTLHDVLPPQQLAANLIAAVKERAASSSSEKKQKTTKEDSTEEKGVRKRDGASLDLRAVMNGIGNDVYVEWFQNTMLEIAEYLDIHDRYFALSNEEMLKQCTAQLSSSSSGATSLPKKPLNIYGTPQPFLLTLGFPASASVSGASTEPTDDNEKVKKLKAAAKARNPPKQKPKTKPKTKATKDEEKKTGESKKNKAKHEQPRKAWHSDVDIFSALQLLESGTATDEQVKTMLLEDIFTPRGLFCVYNKPHAEAKRNPNNKSGGIELVSGPPAYWIVFAVFGFPGRGIQNKGGVNNKSAELGIPAKEALEAKPMAFGQDKETHGLHSRWGTIRWTDLRSNQKENRPMLEKLSDAIVLITEHLNRYGGAANGGAANAAPNKEQWAWLKEAAKRFETDTDKKPFQKCLKRTIELIRKYHLPFPKVAVRLKKVVVEMEPGHALLYCPALPFHFVERSTPGVSVYLRTSLHATTQRVGPAMKHWPMVEDQAKSILDETRLFCGAMEGQGKLSVLSNVDLEHDTGNHVSLTLKSFVDAFSGGWDDAILALQKTKGYERLSDKNAGIFSEAARRVLLIEDARDLKLTVRLAGVAGVAGVATATPNKTKAPQASAPTPPKEPKEPKEQKAAQTAKAKEAGKKRKAEEPVEDKKASSKKPKGGAAAAAPKEKEKQTEKPKEKTEDKKQHMNGKTQEPPKPTTEEAPKTNKESQTTQAEKSEEPPQKHDNVSPKNNNTGEEPAMDDVLSWEF